MRSRLSPFFAAIIAASMLLQACSGRGATIPQFGSVAALPTFGAGSGVVVQTGSVQLPAGSGIAPASLTVSNILSTAAVSGTGTFGVAASGDGPQLAIVKNANGNPLFMGFLGTGEPFINAHTTAEVLIFYAAGLFMLPDTERQQAYAAIAATPGFANVENAVIAAILADPNAFATPGTYPAGVKSAIAALLSSLTTARHARRPASSRRPQDILVDPGNPQSGVTVLNTSPVQISFMNAYRRPVQAFVDQISYGTSIANATQIVPAFQANAISPIPISGAVALKSFKSTIGDIAQGNYAWAPVTTDPFALTSVSNSFWTRYLVTVVGPGLGDGAYSLLSPERKSAQQSATLQFVLQDLFLPMMTSLIIPYSNLDKVTNTPLATEVTQDLVDSFANAPQVYALSNAGDYPGAALAMWNAVVGSNTLQTKILNALVSRAGNVDPAVQAQWAKNFGAAVANGLKIADAGLVAGDFLVAANQVASSNKADVFSVYAVPVKLVLNPLAANLDCKTTFNQRFTINVPSAGGSNLLLEYAWQNTAQAGHFSDLGLHGTDNFTTTVNDGIYTATCSASATDTLKLAVVAFDNSGAAPIHIPLGTVSATVAVTGAPSPSPAPPSPSPSVAPSNCDTLHIPGTTSLWFSGYLPPATFAPCPARAGSVLNIAITTRVVITTDPTANGPVNSLFPVGNAISVTLEEIAGVNRSSVNMCTTPTCDSNGVSADTFTVTIPSNFGPCGEGYAIKLHTVPAGPNESAPMLFGLGTFTLSC